jgi:hemerythrin-like domain-containing protein
MTHPIDILLADHRSVEKLFKDYEELDEHAYETKQKTVERILRELRFHTEMEETLFYPKAKEVLGTEDGKMVEEAYAEHGVMKRLLEELSVTHPEDPQFDARVKVLNENLAHHIKEEEEELLPKASEKLEEQALRKIGENMEAFKQENESEDGDE